MPFERDHDEAKLWAQLSDPPPAPSTLRPDSPAALDAVVARAMAKTRTSATRRPGTSPAPRGRLSPAAPAAGADGRPRRGRARRRSTGARAGAGERHGERGPPDGADGAGACPRARRWALAAVACAAAAAAATVVLLLDGEPSARGGAVVAPTPTATPIARVVSVTHDVGDRPGAIAHAAGDLWIGSRGLTRLTRIDAATGVKRRQQPRVGRGTVSVEAHGDLVWVAVADSRRVIGIDGRTGEIIRRIPLDGEPLRLRADGDGVWVLMRPVKHQWQRLRRFTSSGRERASFRLRHSHSALETGAGSVWLYDAARQGVTRLDARTGRRQHFTKLVGHSATHDVRCRSSVGRDARYRHRVQDHPGRRPDELQRRSHAGPGVGVPGALVHRRPR